MTASETLREMGRIVAGAYEDHQSIRLSQKNRIRDVVRKVHQGIPFDAVEEKKDEKTYAKLYKDENIPELLENMLAEGLISKDEHNYIKKTMEVSKEAESYEGKYKRLMDQFVFNEPIYKEFLEPIKGLGPVICANLIKNFAYCEKAPHISSLWKYCGFHVVCPECTRDKTDVHGNEIKVAVSVDASGKCPNCKTPGIGQKRKRGVSFDWDPKMRTFCWRIADSFVKQRTPVYREIYDREKARQLEIMEKTEKDEVKNKLHADLRARRKMIKIFLSHYWLVARRLTNQEVSEPYSEGKLKHKHIITPEEVVRANKKARGLL